MLENGKWKVLNDLLSQCIRQLKESPDPDFEIVVTIVVMQGGSAVVEYSLELVNHLELREISPFGISTYSLGLSKVAELIHSASLPINAHQPCIVLIGDGHVDEAFEVVLSKSLKIEAFKNSSRLVVEIGNDFNAAHLRSFVSAPTNFYSVVDIATMPFFYMRLASTINSHATISRSRRLLSE